MSRSSFLREHEYYKRSIAPVKDYIELTSFYMSVMTNEPKEKFIEFVKKHIANKTFPSITDPTVTFMRRDEITLDQSKAYMPLTRYISDVVATKEVLAPTFTTYVNPEIETSMLVEYVDGNVANRSIAKKKMMKAKSEKNDILYETYNNMQNLMKIFNNALSGAFATMGSVFNNETAHSTLTSIVRTESSLGNALNEKIIAGNRHYRTPDVALNNVICLSDIEDSSSFEQMMNKYNLHYPTVEQTCKCIQDSTDLYWNDMRQFKRISDYIERLSPLQRAAVVYISDLYHLRIYNREFIVNFLTNLSMLVKDKTYDDPIKHIYTFDAAIRNYAQLICRDYVVNKGKEYHEMSLETVNILAATCENIDRVVKEHKLLIDNIFLSRNVPCSTAYIKDMVRKAVVLSDTDSTMFSVDEFVIDRFKYLSFKPEAQAYGASVFFIATQSIAHVLAMFSANMGVHPTKLYDIEMKPEFGFPIFGQSPVAKHYFTGYNFREGDVYDEITLEKKGVHMKNSANPKSIMDVSEKMMVDIMKTVYEEKKISMKDYLLRTMEVEKTILESLGSGKHELYRLSKIKTEDSYKKSAEESPYANHILWEEVFQPKYGRINKPPYSVYKIPTILNNITAIKKWLDSLEDQEFKSRMTAWIIRKNKTQLNTLYFDQAWVASYGLPKEVIPLVNRRKITLDLTISHRLVLQTLGYFPKPKLLISEHGLHFTPEINTFEPIVPRSGVIRVYDSIKRETSLYPMEVLDSSNLDTNILCV